MRLIFEIEKVEALSESHIDSEWTLAANAVALSYLAGEGLAVGGVDLCWIGE